MGKIKGYNVRLYLGNDLLAHSTEVALNLNTGTEDVTDNKSGDWTDILPTLNSWSIDTSEWYSNAVGTGEANFDDVMTAWMSQARLFLTCEIESGVNFSGYGYLTNVTVSGGTGAGYVKFTAGFQGAGEIS